MIAVHTQGVELLPALIGHELKKDNALEAVGGVRFITDLSYGLPRATNLSHYIENVKGHAARRHLVKVGAATIERAKELRCPVPQSLDWVKHQLVGLDTVVIQPDLVQRWSEVSELNLPIGDEIIHELEKGELGLLNSVTNAGKSTWLRNLSLSLACGRPFPKCRALPQSSASGPSGF